MNKQVIKYLAAAGCIVGTLMFIFVCYAIYDYFRWGHDFPGQHLTERLMDSAVGQAAKAPPEAMERLRRLGERFGELDTDWLVTAGCIIEEAGIDDPAEFERQFDLIDLRIKNSNTGSNLGTYPLKANDKLLDRLNWHIHSSLEDKKIEGFYTTPGFVVQRRNLEKWQSYYEDDVRFWELWFINEWLYSNEDENLAVARLVEADSRGLATVDTVLMTFLAEYCIIVESAGEDSELAAQMLADAEGQLLAILDQAKAIDPEHAWPHYFNALLCYELGDTAAGLKCLKEGNACANNDYPRLALYRQYEDGIYMRRPTGSAIASGQLFSWYISMPSFEYSTYKAFQQASFDLYDESKDREILQAWHEFSCRISESWPADSLHILVGVMSAQRIADHISELGDETFSAAETDVLNRIRGGIHSGREAYKKHDGGLLDTEALFLFTAAGSAWGRNVCLYLMEESSVKACDAHIEPLVVELSGIDYRRLAMPESLLKYPPLELDDVKAFKAGTFEWEGEETD